VYKRQSQNPNAIHIIEANLDKINWRSLSQNPNAIYLLEANPEKIVWDNVWINPTIFDVYDAPILK
jgi:hypothetical protein